MQKSMHCRSPSISEMAAVGLDSSGTPGYPVSFPSCFICLSLSFPFLSFFVSLSGFCCGVCMAEIRCFFLLCANSKMTENYNTMK